MKLRSLYRINRRIDEGLIKKIYCDGWNRMFINKIGELFGDRVAIYELKISDKFINSVSFEQSDCILFDDLFIKNYKKYDALVQKAKHDGVFIKILTEDIYDVEVVKDTDNNVVGYELNKEEIIGKALMNYYHFKRCNNLVDMNAEQFFTTCHMMLKAFDIKREQ